MDPMTMSLFTDEVEKSIRKYDATTSIAVKDLISKLPEPLLHEILSLLPPEESARMAVLSKTWRRANKSQGLIDFNLHFQGRYSEEYRERIKSFHPQISTYRQHKRKLAIRSCSLSLIPSISPTSYEYQLDSRVSCLMRFLSVQSTVQVIVIKVQGYAGFLDISNLLQPITIAKSLAILNLKGFCFEKAIPLGEPKFFFPIMPSLRKLSLVNCRLGNYQLRILLSNGPNLEILHLDHLRPRNVNTLVIHDHPGLKDISIQHNNVSELKIYVQNLESLSIEPYYIGYLDKCINLKTLRLGFLQVTSDMIRSVISNFSSLETLTLSGSLSSEKIEISAPHVRSLSLEFRNPPEEVKIIEAPSLCRYSYSGERFLSWHHCLNSLCLQEVNLKMRLSGESDPTWFFINLRHNLAMFNPFITVLELDFQNIGLVQFKPKELGIFPIDPTPARLNCLKLIGFPFHDLDHAALLDCLLWSCHPTTLFCQCPKLWLSSYRFMKFLFHELSEATKQNPFCCGDDQNLRCWRHYLRKANFERYDYRGQLSIKFKLEWN